jgi:activator of 2-hydroxyglutaryl-CoA dehydratase
VTRKIRIAHLSCGSEYSGVQKEIQDAVEAVNAEIVFPEVDTEDIKDAVKEWGLEVASPDLQLMIARAKSIVDGGSPVDAVFISTCFRCAEAAITRSELRRYIHERAHLPVIS